MSNNPNAFTQSEIDAVYKAIYQRRDMRHFLPAPLDDELLLRLLSAAHAAPSVGFMQPWRFIRIQDSTVKQQLHDIVQIEKDRTVDALGKRGAEFAQLKVEGLLECGELLVVSLMDKRDKHVFGRRTLPQMDLASVSCAIQNMWLAARAEGIGMGWVSIFAPESIQQCLDMPDDTVPVAILCLGKVKEFYPQPMLISEGWAERGKLEDYVMLNSWDSEKADSAQEQWNSLGRAEKNSLGRADKE